MAIAKHTSPPQVAIIVRAHPNVVKHVKDKKAFFYWSEQLESQIIVVVVYPQSSNVFQHGIIGTVQRAIPDKIIGPYLYFPFLFLLLHLIYKKNIPNIAIVKAAVNTCPIVVAIAGAATFNSPKSNVGQHHAPIKAGTDNSIRNTKQTHP